MTFDFCRSGAIVCFFITIGIVVATPTAPVFPDVSSLPIWYLVNSTAGDLTVTTVEPADESTVAAKGRYNASNGVIGWDYCHIKANDTVQGYYAAGYLEGIIGNYSISFFNWSNAVAPTDASNKWVDEHLHFLRKSINEYKETDPFWDRIGKIFAQMEGIADGYSTASGTGITFKQVFLNNFGNEIGDVVTATNLMEGKIPDSNVVKQTHCSALIKVTSDDLFVAHDTWSGFSGLGIRVYKVYQFGDFRIAMDSFPAIVASGTDWYVTSNELAIQETTNIVFNTSLYSSVVPHTVSEFLRVMAANYLSTTGEEWTTTFGDRNSGTYNNQYMVVDFKKYSPGQSLPDGILWIAEQIPGHVSKADVTHVLRETGYWASYNINYFEDLYKISGYEEMEQEQGTFWSYTKYARPEIFRRNQTYIKTVEDMQRMMRYNDYLNDVFSIIPNCTGADAACNEAHTAMLTIASRGDLMELFNTTEENIRVYGPLYDWVAQGCFGAIDSKIASYKNRHHLTGLVISGPTNDQQPTFAWGENANCPKSQQPAGGASTFDFPWVSFTPSDL